MRGVDCIQVLLRGRFLDDDDEDDDDLDDLVRNWEPGLDVTLAPLLLLALLLFF